MRPDTLLMAKLSWLLLFASGYWYSLRAPAVPGANLLGPVPGGSGWLAAAFWIAGGCLLCNRQVRGACVVLGGVVLLAPFESIVVWHPFAWVCGGVLLLCALQAPGSESRFVRWFLVLVHCGAALGAIDGAGWITTALAPPWSEDQYLGALPRSITEFLPGHVLVPGLTWGTILVCIVVPIGLLVPRSRRAAAGLALWFYTLLYLTLGSTEVLLFGGAIAVAQISCLEWPRYIKVVWPRACGWPLFLRVVVDRYDFEDRTDWPRPADPDAELEAWFDLRRVTGTRAVINLLLSFPAFYFIVLTMFAAVHALLPRVIAVSINGTLAMAILAFSSHAAWRSLRSRSRMSAPPNSPPPKNGTDDNGTPSRPLPTTLPDNPGTRDATAETDTPRRTGR
jgi:hypothetical protein